MYKRQDFSSVHPSIYHSTPDEAVDWFEQNAENDCAIWIDEGGGDKYDWVAFRGAFLIEQYKAPDAGGPAELDFRWPLVRSCAYVTGFTVLSGLVIDWFKQPRYYLDLNLPLPARRSTRPGKDDLNPQAFPFGAVFEAVNGKYQDILRFTTLVGGWIRNDAIDTKDACLLYTSPSPRD